MSASIYLKLLSSTELRDGELQTQYDAKPSSEERWFKLAEIAGHLWRQGKAGPGCHCAIALQAKLSCMTLDQILDGFDLEVCLWRRCGGERFNTVLTLCQCVHVQTLLSDKICY